MKRKNSWGLKAKRNVAILTEQVFYGATRQKLAQKHKLTTERIRQITIVTYKQMAKSYIRGKKFNTITITKCKNCGKKKEMGKVHYRHNTTLKHNIFTYAFSPHSFGKNRPEKKCHQCKRPLDNYGYYLNIKRLRTPFCCRCGFQVMREQAKWDNYLARFFEQELENKRSTTLTHL